MITKSSLAALLSLAAGHVVRAQDSSSNFVPLASQSFAYNNLPYHADPNNGDRGTQTGYNICNSTTENQESLCQTAIINSIDDFCLWGPTEPNEVIGNVEGECVAWCTKKGHGTRIIPKGAITGIQFIQTPDYVQVTGNIHQQLIDIAESDDGGELDPHGADQRGNPLGALLFSNAFASQNGNTNYVQAIEWHNFMGGGQFCLKACDPNRPNAARYCEHIFDRIGCAYNAPASYADGVFESCLGDSQDFPGIYTGADGVVSTYTQPPESLGPIQSLPYTPKIPATSSCTPYSSAQLWTDAVSATVDPNSSSSSTTRSSTTRTSNTRTVTSTVHSSSSSGAAFVASPAQGGLAVGLLGAIGALFF